MKTEALHLGLRVKHPQYGTGTVKAISSGTAEILFLEGLRTVSPEASGLEPDEPQLEIGGRGFSLQQWIDESVAATLRHLGVESPGEVAELGTRWRKGTLELRPADASVAGKEIPLETFFHKIVLMRNNLRVLEQKINGHAGLADAEKVELQQYITRCYGSMTTFNVLFREESGQFKSKGREDES